MSTPRHHRMNRDIVEYCYNNKRKVVLRIIHILTLQLIILEMDGDSFTRSKS